jgi:hypothetical protein|tara:strand:- start:748 stop:1446 length:699 start_codon:yes stop_codon:yes gene_type:complete
MKEPGKGEVAQLFISLIGKKLTIEEVSKESELSVEQVAELISDQESLRFFKKEGEQELKISCDYSWISVNLSKKIKLRTKEIEEINIIMETKFPKHAEKYWSEEKKITRDLISRTLGEWIESELSFLAGFSLWFREKELDGNLDLSTLISDAVGENVSASGNIEFDRKRLELLKTLTTNALTVLKDMSPAGKIAYRSMDVAIIKGISDGDENYANKMQGRTLPQEKAWWKFW